MPRFSVRSVVELHIQGDQVYEERITLWQADSFDHAMELALAEAQAYAADIGGVL